jgi:6-pyruvoyltetrahydropterin/6-carboxytetrahydropterin synthase
MKPQVTLSRTAYFSAGRRLYHPAWSGERNRQVFGKESSPHGHDYTLMVFYSGAIGAEDGMVVNITDIKPILARILERLDGKFLDVEVEYFQQHRPTAENIVNFIWQELPSPLGTARLSRLCLQETSRLWVEKIESHKTENTMRLTRKYEFAAAHRLHVPQWSDEANDELYGKCNSPRGHGHNYGLEVTVEGEPDAETGAIMALDDLDRIVDEEVFENYDHKHLNEDCPEFADLVPTSENLARVIFDRLQARLNGEGHRLAKIGLHETQKNYFEVES